MNIIAKGSGKLASTLLPMHLICPYHSRIKPFIMPLMEKLQTFLFQSLGIELSSSQANAFLSFENLLLGWNKKFNLTSITDPEGIYVKHFLDSLTALRVIQNNKDFSLIDIGTGAGFPGIPIKIMLPEMALTLVESSQKKVEFCKAVVNELNLTKTSVIAARAEDLGKDPFHREIYDWAVARAVAELSVLAEYLLPFVKIGGKALAMKGTNAEGEIQKAGHALAVLGGEIFKKENLCLPKNYGERTLIVIRKIGATPKAFPRRAGMPYKKPIK